MHAKPPNENFTYIVGCLVSLVFHLALAAIAIVILETRAATATQAPEIFSVTIEAGVRLGGITQVPKEKAESKPPPSDAAPIEDQGDTSADVEEVKAEKKLEAPSVVEDPEEVLAKKKAEEAKEKAKQEAEKKKKQQEEKKKELEKKKADEAKRKAAEEEKRKKAEQRKKEEEKKRKANEKKRFKEMINRYKSKTYEGESVDAGGEGLGAARTGGSGMGGGLLASREKIAYADALNRHVKEGWRWLAGGTRFVAKVLVRILPDGVVQDVRVVQSSGNGNFDDSVVRAIRKASPVPPPPERYYADFREVRFTFDSADRG